MNPTPILTAETILTTAIRTALAPFVGLHQGRPKVYYQLNTDGAPRPLIVFQFQSDISRLDWVGNVGATALVTIKAQADDPDSAAELLADASPGMAGLAFDGYSLAAVYVRSPIIPPIADVYQSAHIFRITLTRS